MRTETDRICQPLCMYCTNISSTFCRRCNERKDATRFQEQGYTLPRHDKFTSTFDENIWTVLEFKRDRLTRCWRKLYNLHCPSGASIRVRVQTRVGWAAHVARIKLRAVSIVSNTGRESLRNLELERWTSIRLTVKEVGWGVVEGAQWAWWGFEWLSDRQLLKNASAA